MRLAAQLFLLSAMGLAGCASTEKPLSRPGSYSVPVTKPALEKYAKFNLDAVQVQQQSTQITIGYTLPLELTGTANPVQFTGPVLTNGAVVLTGKNGTMECPDAEELNDCKVAYKDVNFDPSARTEVLKAIARTPEELKTREAVAVAFEAGGEPHGVLNVYRYRPPRGGSYNPR